MSTQIQPPAPASAAHQVELAIGGMTCASCANRIERRLNKLDGVTATVNYATEKARVTFPEGLEPALLVTTVERAGYTARLPEASPAPPGSAEGPDRIPLGRLGAGAAAEAVTGGEDARAPGRDETAALRQRLLVSLVLSVAGDRHGDDPRRCSSPYWQWLSLTLAAPVVVWGAWPFHRAAWTEPAARRRHHGHPHLDGHAGRVRLVAVRPVPRHRRACRGCGTRSS